MDSLQKNRTNKEKNIIGFLYSRSRQGMGELWPLYAGDNTIGSSSENDIQLKEAYVSSHHACITVKESYPEGQWIAYVKNFDSKLGCRVNGEKSEEEKLYCKSGDVLTVGSHYELLVGLFNLQKCNLSASPDFEPIEDTEEESGESIATSIYQHPSLPQEHGRFNPYSAENRRFIRKSTVSTERAVGESSDDRTIVM